jgi:hypothetical protein
MTGITHKALVKEIASNKPDASTAFNLPDSATAPARSFDSALASGAVVPYHATNGTDWEDGLGTFTAGSPDTLARSQILDSSTGSAIDFSAGGDVTVRIVWPASIATETDLLMRAAVPGGRLTLASGIPDYQPLNTVAVSGQDTSADTITVTAHGWTVGTMVKSSATSGGLTASTQYYAGNITANTISLHTTLAAALAGTSKVDITGTVTANIAAHGVANTSIYYTPYNHNLISLWNGVRWQTVEFAETTLALGTLTASKPYDVFAYLNAGVLALELLAWTSDTVRATDVTRQDGRLCKSGDKTRLLLGTIYTVSTTATERSKINLNVANCYNTLPFYCEIRDETTSWTYSTAAYRQANASAANQINIVTPMPAPKVSVVARNRVNNSTTTYRDVYTGIGVDSTTAAMVSFKSNASSTPGYQDVQCIQDILTLSAGRHFIVPLEYGGGIDTQTWLGQGSQKLMVNMSA